MHDNNSAKKNQKQQQRDRRVLCAAKEDSICLPSVSKADKRIEKRLSQTGVNVLIKTLFKVF